MGTTLVMQKNKYTAIFVHVQLMDNTPTGELSLTAQNLAELEQRPVSDFARTPDPNTEERAVLELSSNTKIVTRTHVQSTASTHHSVHGTNAVLHVVVE